MVLEGLRRWLPVVVHSTFSSTIATMLSYCSWMSSSLSSPASCVTWCWVFFSCCFCSAPEWCWSHRCCAIRPSFGVCFMGVSHVAAMKMCARMAQISSCVCWDGFGVPTWRKLLHAQESALLLLWGQKAAWDVESSLLWNTQAFPHENVSDLGEQKDF